jgi:hypothetical protein
MRASSFETLAHLPGKSSSESQLHSSQKLAGSLSYFCALIQRAFISKVFLLQS